MSRKHFRHGGITDSWEQGTPAQRPKGAIAVGYYNRSSPWCSGGVAGWLVGQGGGGLMRGRTKAVYNSHHIILLLALLSGNEQYAASD
jgi:hypothetical protein